ncbi:MAG: PQQ-binding-like beta-propeller repeat protein [Candidatus Caldarchaeum sp.]
MQLYGRVALIFLLAALVAAANARPVGEWVSAGGGPHNTKYSQVTALTSGNANQLLQEWFLPVPPSRTGGLHGVTHPILIKYGVGYVVTNSYLVVSFDLRGGKIFWTIELQQPSLLNPSIMPDRLAHLYQVLLLKSGNEEMLAIGTSWQRVYLLDSFTGRLIHSLDLIMANEVVDGNRGKYGGVPVNLIYDSRRNILVVGSSVPDSEDAGRGFVDGYAVSREGVRRLWRTFLMPSQTQSDHQWSLNLVKKTAHAWVMDGDNVLDLKALDEKMLSDILLNDWAASNEAVTKAGLMAGWMNGWSVDEEKGVAYVGVASPSPSLDASGRRGPNLLSSSVIAVKVETGEILWFFQAIPHDIWGYGCNGGTALAGDLVLALCGNGRLYALDRSTGKPVWMFKPPSLPTIAESSPLSIFDKSQMATPYVGYGYKKTGEKAHIAPPPFTLLSFAVDPSSGKVFYALPLYGEDFELNPPLKPKNYQSVSKQSDAVLYVLELSTGRVVWEKKLGSVGNAFISATSNIILLQTSSGNFYIISENDGGILYSKQNVGGAMTHASIGVDVEGNIRIMLPVSMVDDPGYLSSLRLIPLENEEGVETAVVTEHTTITRTVTVLPELNQLQGGGFLLITMLIIIAAAVSLTLFWRTRVSRKSQPE